MLGSKKQKRNSSSWKVFTGNGLSTVPAVTKILERMKIHSKIPERTVTKQHVPRD